MFTSRIDPSPPSKSANFAVILFILSILITGLIILYVGLRPVYLYYKSSDWPTASGTIDSVKFTYKSGSKNPRPDPYYTEATYHFEHNGVTYYGSKVSAGLLVMYDEEAQYEKLKHAMEFKEPIPIIFNPSNPNESLLFRTYSMRILAPAWVGGSVIAGIGILLLVLMWKYSDSPSEIVERPKS